MQYQNMVESSEEIPRHSKDLRSSRKLRKLVAILRLDKPVFSTKISVLKN